MTRFIFRLESNPKIGMGHFYRCLSLAKLLKENPVLFLMNEFDTVIARILTDSGIELKALGEIPPYEPCSELLTRHISSQDIVILDGYHFDDRYMKALKQLCGALVVIDDLVHGTYHADMIINHGPQAERVTYNLASSSTKLLLGSKYALLRTPFFEMAGQGCVRSKVEIVSICFGGADPKNLSLKCLTALQLMKTDFIVNLVMGAANHNDAGSYLKNTAAGLKVNVIRNQTEDQMAQLILTSDLLICSPSGIAFEACTINVPLVVIAGFDNQQSLSTFLNEKNLATVIDERECSNSPKVAARLSDICANQMYREQQTANQRVYFDGQSASRLKHELEALATTNIK